MKQLIEIAEIIRVFKHLLPGSPGRTHTVPVFSELLISGVVIILREVVDIRRVVDCRAIISATTTAVHVLPQCGNVIACNGSWLHRVYAAHPLAIIARMLGDIAQVIERALMNQMFGETYVACGRGACRARFLAARLRIRGNLHRFISLQYMSAKVNNQLIALLKVLHAINAAPNARGFVIEDGNENVRIEVERGKSIRSLNVRISYWGRRDRWRQNRRGGAIRGSVRRPRG